MPYKDKTKQQAAQRASMRKRRDVKPSDVKPINLPPQWQHIHDYIQEPCPGMNRLERVQRIAGSLGRHAKDVWFGVQGPTAEEMGRVLGAKGPLLGK